jgi:hypothetical protein
MEKASTDTKVAKPTMVIGLTIFSMEMESKYWKMGRSTQVNLEMGRSMVWALIPGLTVRITKASGAVTKLKDLEFTSGQMAEDLKEVGLKINFMVAESTRGLMAGATTESTWRIKSTALVSTSGQTERSTKGIGKTENSTVRGSLQTRKANQE